MMIQSPSAGDPYARAAALDHALRSPNAGGVDASSNDADTPPLSSPDIVVTLSQGSSVPRTYDASGRLSGKPTLDDLGANAADSMAQASESGSEAPDDASVATTDPASAAPAPATADVNVEEDAVPA